MSASSRKRCRIEPQADHNSPIPISATLRLKTFQTPLTSSQTGSHVDSIRLTSHNPRCTVGRSRRLCQFVLEEHRRIVSKRHCQIVFDARSGHVCILDGSEGAGVGASLNGVFVNGTRIGAGEAVVLCDGDVVGLGCRNGGVCCKGNVIGFVVDKIVLEQGVEKMLSGGFDVGATRTGCIIGRANCLLSLCKMVLHSHDPVSTIRKLQISDSVLTYGNKLIVHDTERNKAASGVVGAEDMGVIQKSFTDKEWGSRSVGIFENKRPFQLSGKTPVSQGDVNPSDKLKALPLCPKIIDNPPLDSSKGKHRVGLSCPPPGKSFYLNNLKSMNFVPSGDHVSVSLPELLYPVESLSRIFIATFTSDIPWFLGTCEIPVHLPVTIACHNTERCWSAKPDSRFSMPYSDFPKLVLVYPPFPESLAFGSDRTKRGVACHHPKLLVLLREHSVRVIITSANLVEKQWSCVTNTVWWQDFPRRIAPDYLSIFSTLPDTNQVCGSDFAAQLAGLVAILVTDVPSQAYWVVELAKYDFQDASGHLVVSVPGIHSFTLPYHSELRLSSFAACVAPSLRPGYLGSIDTFVVGLSHLFCTKSDSSGLQLKKLASFFANCHTTAYGMLEVVLRRNKNIAADANAVSVFVPNEDNFSVDDYVQLGFVPRDVARWLSPLWDAGFFDFSGFLNPNEAIEVALGNSIGKKVRLSLHVSQGPHFSNLSKMMQVEHAVAFCSLIASIQKCLGLWRLQEVIGRHNWPEPLETDFVYGSSSIGSSLSPQFLATFSAAIGKKAHNFPDSEESDPEKTWQRLRPAGIFHDAVPHPQQRVGHPMHVKVAMRRFQSKTDTSSFGWVYCGSHNFSAAAWGRVVNTTERKRSVSDEMQSSRHNSTGLRLHICNYEVGIVFLFPPPGSKNVILPFSKQDNANIDEIVLPFIMPPPKYKSWDRPATFQALREALIIERANQKYQLLPQDDVLETEEEEIVMEEDSAGDIIEAIENNFTVENEEDKAYAEELWSQVDSSQNS
uniref:FHA domain-containing protein n=1 Tax=Kalanchoe fedtschenkoi TaxID=63787 RepID=A0A7N0ZQX6_KALFE